MSYQIIFHSTTRSECPATLTVEATDFNEIYIEIKDTEAQHDLNYQYICLDKETAIKLSKELRKQISFLEA